MASKQRAVVIKFAGVRINSTEEAVRRELECLYAPRVRAEAQTATALQQRRVAESARRKQVEQERQASEAQKQQVANASCRRSTRVKAHCELHDDAMEFQRQVT